jgi:hypothetical protein
MTTTKASDTMTNEKMHTLVLTDAELELIYDQLNLVELYDDSEENLELLRSINDKVYKETL